MYNYYIYTNIIIYINLTIVSILGDMKKKQLPNCLIAQLTTDHSMPRKKGDGQPNVHHHLISKT